jgi:hypothetical protein
VKEIEILKRLLDQANAIEAETGEVPTAVEALTWAIDEITHYSLSRKQASHRLQPQAMPPVVDQCTQHESVHE